ncbi:TlpA disulfide reductase family protein [Microlunatus spumicola]|uniref:TlpA disulfide reductase family protein n=2 Tax=Microlunatus spumicola TaxID=81499 RepID=A0ABP6XGJ4_9ACTN
MNAPMTAVQAIRRLQALAGVLAVLALVLLMMWWRPWSSNDDNALSRANDGTGVTAEPGLDLYPAASRVPAPKLEGTTLDDKPLALSQLAGDIVVINVWGSWCAPCRAETPDLVRVATEQARRGVSFVGINTRDNPDAAKAFVRANKVAYPSVVDHNGEVLLALRDTIPTTAVPTSVVIDRQGRVAARIIGPVTYTTLQGLLDDEIAASKATR